MQILRGTVTTGRREAAGFLALPWVGRLLREGLGFEPYPGTLNLGVETDRDRTAWEEMKRDGACLRLAPPQGSDLCAATVLPVWIEGTEPGGIVLPHVDGYPPNQVEVVAEGSLRDRFDLADGDLCRVAAKELSPRPFDSVLFDLEGTLVDFQWRLDAAEAELRTTAAELGLDPILFAEDDYAAIHRRAHQMLDPTGRRDEVDRSLGPVYDRYDLDALSRWSLRDGARDLLADLRAGRVRTALVSNIGRKAVEGALDGFGLRGNFDAVITRDDVTRMKPHGEGITIALRALGCPLSRALMVGDSLSDFGAARDAGVRVAIVSGGQSTAAAIERAGPDFRLEGLPEVFDLV